MAYDLWQARQRGETISAERADLPATLAEAHAVQDAVVALSGMAACGYKVGSTSAEAQRLLGTDEPAASVLLAPFVQESPARIALAPAQMPAVEGEFAFRIGRDLPARGARYTLAEVLAAVDGVAGAVEVVGTRFAGGLPGKGRFLTTADCGVNIGLALGGWTVFSGQDLRAHPVTMHVNGAPKGSGTGSRALGDPVNVLLWLVNHLSERGRSIAAGAVVATGTCTGLDPVAPGDSLRADFGALGAVEIAFG